MEHVLIVLFVLNGYVISDIEIFETYDECMVVGVQRMDEITRNRPNLDKKYAECMPKWVWQTLRTD